MKVSTFPQTQSRKPRVNQTVADLPPSGIRRFFDLVVSRQGVISLGVGEPDFVTPWHICEAGIHSLESGRTSYTSNSGLLALREEIAQYLEATTGNRYDPVKEILITVGASEAVDLIFRTLLEPGDEVIVIDPSIVAYPALVTLAGGIPVRIATRPEYGFAPRREDLDRAVSPRTRALMLNYPNNPTGAALSRDQIEEIADFVTRNDLILISDEIYLPLTYEGDPISFASLPAVRNHLVLLHGFSKAWAMTGWRLGFAAGPPDLIAAMTKIHQYAIMCPPTMAQHAAVEALKNGHKEVESMRLEYDRRRRFISHHLNRMGLTCMIPQGAFYVFPSIQSTGLSSQEFAERLLDEYNVAVVPGTAFGECGEGYIRCSYATSLDALREALRRIEAFVTDHRSTTGETNPPPFREP